MASLRNQTQVPPGSRLSSLCSPSKNPPDELNSHTHPKPLARCSPAPLDETPLDNESARPTSGRNPAHCGGTRVLPLLLISGKEPAQRQNAKTSQAHSTTTSEARPHPNPDMNEVASRQLVFSSALQAPRGWALFAYSERQEGSIGALWLLPCPWPRPWPCEATPVHEVEICHLAFFDSHVLRWVSAMRCSPLESKRRSSKTRRFFF